MKYGLRVEKIASVNRGVSSVTRRGSSCYGHSLSALNIPLVPACWTLPPLHLNTSDLGSAAGVQISSGSSVSAAVKLAVVFGTR